MGSLNYQLWVCNQTNTLLRVIPTPTYYSDIISGIYSDVLSGILSHSLFDILSGIIWHLFWHSMTFYLVFYLASILTFYLGVFLAFYLTVQVQACPISGAGGMVIGSRHSIWSWQKREGGVVPLLSRDPHLAGTGRWRNNRNKQSKFRGNRQAKETAMQIIWGYLLTSQLFLSQRVYDWNWYGYPKPEIVN